MTGTMPIGYRRDGTPIRLIQGGADDPAPEPQAPLPAAPPADDTAGLRAELDAARAQAAQTEERLRALMAGGGGQAPPAPTGDDPDDDHPISAGGKPVDPEIAKLRKLLEKVNKENAARRFSEDQLREEWASQDKAKEAALAEAQRVSEAREKALLEAESRYKPATIKAAAMPALLAAGAKPGRADRLVKLLDMGKLDVDPGGEVTGLAEQVAAVKADWPELFGSDEPEKRPVPRVATGDRAPVEDKPTRSADILARQALGGAA